jgi:pyruvate formate lyase activating enzyme
VEECAFNARRLVGHSIGSQALIRLVERDKPFFDESGGGVTFSGGEPLLQLEFLLECLALCQKAGLHTAVDTSGYAPAESVLKLLPVTDLFLFDLKIIDPLEHQAHTGVDNTGILENLRLLDAQGARIWIRVPLVPKMTDSSKNIEAIGAAVSGLQNVERVSLLPYHGLAARRSTVALSEESLVRATRILEKQGLRVHLKG